MAIGDPNRINSNIGSLNSLNALADINRQLSISQLRLSTGKRINEAADDPSGYSIANSFGQKARGLGVALGSIQTAENVLSIAEGALNNINDILMNMRDLVVQASSDTLGATERNAITSQITSLNAEVDRIASKTSFNGTALLDGSFTNKRFQTGDTGVDNINFSISSNFNSTSVGLSLVSVTSSTTASNSLASLDAAVTLVTGMVQSLGSTTQRLRLIENNLSVAITNTTAAKSRILDADVAQEQANSTRLQILRQLATAQLAQANTSPQSILSLFK